MPFQEKEGLKCGINECLHRNFPTARQGRYCITRKHDTYLWSNLLICSPWVLNNGFNMLSTMIPLIKCTDAKYSESLNFYHYTFRDGLQSYLLIKCSYCHLVNAEFPTSLLEGWNKMLQSITMLCRKKSEVNVRALLAMYCTSASQSFI